MNICCSPQESFFGHIKDHVKSRSCSTREDLQQAIDGYIAYYNNYRYQWGLKKMTPVQCSVQESPFVI
ncbi:IS3 family transposase [Paenibacillus agricola]|uniref:IS3 family transposase n=1 Tax=Paenibacillus agricola TaxID=2716264 RepID=UPI0035D3D9D5